MPYLGTASATAERRVAVRYLDCWYYIDERDHDSRATFALVLHMTNGVRPAAAAPVLTPPIGIR